MSAVLSRTRSSSSTSRTLPRPWRSDAWGRASACTRFGKKRTHTVPGSSSFKRFLLASRGQGELAGRFTIEAGSGRTPLPCSARHDGLGISSVAGIGEWAM
jgi:hypothetical protein